MICRKGVHSDHGAIVAFQLAMARETEGLELDRAVCGKGVRAVLDDPSKGEYFVCERDSKVIASLMITYEWSDWRNGNVWWIQSVYVLPEERGKGAFSALHGHVKGIVERDPGLRGLRLYVDRRNRNAQAVYARIGMTNDHYELFEWMKTP